MMRPGCSDGGLHIVVVDFKQPPLVEEAAAIEAGPALTLVRQVPVPIHDLLPLRRRPHFSGSLLLLGRLELVQLPRLIRICLNFILKHKLNY